MIGKNKENTEIKKLAKRIESLRKEQKLTKEKLAFYSDLPKSNIIELLQCKRNPRYTTLIKISKGLGISISELLKF